jgi:hypothetical protein
MLAPATFAAELPIGDAEDAVVMQEKAQITDRAPPVCYQL